MGKEKGRSVAASPFLCASSPGHRLDTHSLLRGVKWFHVCLSSIGKFFLLVSSALLIFALFRYLAPLCLQFPLDLSSTVLSIFILSRCPFISPLPLGGGHNEKVYTTHGLPCYLLKL